MKSVRLTPNVSQYIDVETGNGTTTFKCMSWLPDPARLGGPSWQKVYEFSVPTTELYDALFVEMHIDPPRDGF